MALPLKGLLRVSALATVTATDMGSMASDPLMPTTELLPLPMLSNKPIQVLLGLISRSRAFTPELAMATELATSTKD